MIGVVKTVTLSRIGQTEYFLSPRINAWDFENALSAADERGEGFYLLLRKNPHYSPALRNPEFVISFLPAAALRRLREKIEKKAMEHEIEAD